MPTLLQLSKMFQTPIALARLEQAIRIVAYEVMSEPLSAPADQQLQQRYMRRQNVAKEWGKSPAHWARIIGPSLVSIANLADYIGDWEKEELEESKEMEMDNALLSAIRLKIDDYLMEVSLS